MAGVSSESLKAFHSSAKSDWITPPYIIEAARRTMGAIDLDPASSEVANTVVKAGRFFIDGGLVFDWRGNVWLNPPYGRGEGNRSNMELWSQKLLREWHSGRVKQAILLVKGAPSELWFQELLKFPVCFTKGRVQFLDTNLVPVKSNPHGTAIIGVNVNKGRFAHEFRKIGTTVMALPPLYSSYV